MVALSQAPTRYAQLKKRMAMLQFSYGILLMILSPWQPPKSEGYLTAILMGKAQHPLTDWMSCFAEEVPDADNTAVGASKKWRKALQDITLVLSFEADSDIIAATVLRLCLSSLLLVACYLGDLLTGTRQMLLPPRRLAG
jgi:hypothetical protein